MSLAGDFATLRTLVDQKLIDAEADAADKEIVNLILLMFEIVVTDINALASRPIEAEGSFAGPHN